MRFFKYFIFLFCIPSLANAAIGYRLDNFQLYSGIHESPSALCTASVPSIKKVYPSVTKAIVVGERCHYLDASNALQNTKDFLTTTYTPKCFYPDYKIVSQPIASLKKSICLPVNGAMCKYVGDPTSSPVINGSITTTFESVSSTSDPDCKEQLVNPPCDPKDPYGGCFTPADDGCTRQFDGSIVCPEEKAPPVEKGCGLADYCDRPPQGCGDGYVSGKFNGKLICIKTNPSTGTGGDGTGTGTGGDGTGTGTGSSTGEGTGTSTSTGTQTSTTTNSDGSSTTTNTTTTNITNNTFSIDFSPVTNAINEVSSKLTNLKNELITSLNELGLKIDSTNTKIDQTNSKLDTTNTKLSEINDSSLRQEDLLKAIRDKESPTGGDGSPSDQPASGASIDLTETNGLLTEIRDGIYSIKDVFSDEGKSELEQIGQDSNDSRYLNAQGNAQSSLNNLANKLTFSNSACLSDFQIQLPIFGSINIALSQWCPLLALLKILLNLIVLLACLRMLDATVRTI